MRLELELNLEEGFRDQPIKLIPENQQDQEALIELGRHRLLRFKLTKKAEEIEYALIVVKTIN